jgi:hypothetical protein
VKTRALWSCLVAALFALAFAAGCGSGQTRLRDPFASAWHAEPGRAEALVRELRSAPVLNVPAVAVAVTSGTLTVIGLDSGGINWSQPLKTDGMPIVAGLVVVAASHGALLGIDTMTGRSLWSVPAPNASLSSASDDGTLTLVSIGLAGSGHDQLLAIGRNGSVAFRLRTPRTTGSVQAVAGLGFVPWAGRTISAVALADGEERLRISFPSGVTDALWVGGELYFAGDDHFVHFDERIDTAAPTMVELPRSRLPDRPPWRPNFASPEPSDGGQGTAFALYARPTMHGPQLEVDHGRLVGVWGPLVVGIDVARAEAVWVRTLDAAPLAVAAARRGYAMCSARGHALWVDPDGGLTDRNLFQNRPGKCMLQVGDLQAPNGASPPPLLDQLTAAIAKHGEALAMVQTWLTARLGSLPEPEATRALIDIASDSTTPPTVTAQAKESLARRTNGIEYMLQALARHYDFLGQILNPPPVAALAEALARAHETRAAPLLAEQLNDPANTPTDVEHAALALESLATPKQAEALSTFLSLYRATADQPELVAAVVSVARALIRVGGAEGAAQVKQAANDPLTLPEIKRQLKGLETDQPRDAGSLEQHCVTRNAAG